MPLPNPPAVHLPPPLFPPTRPPVIAHHRRRSSTITSSPFSLPLPSPASSYVLTIVTPLDLITSKPPRSPFNPSGYSTYILSASHLDRFFGTTTYLVYPPQSIDITNNNQNLLSDSLDQDDAPYQTNTFSTISKHSFATAAFSQYSPSALRTRSTSFPRLPVSPSRLDAYTKLAI